MIAIWFTAFSVSDREKRVKRLLAADISAAVPLDSTAQPESLNVGNNSSSEGEQSTDELPQLSLPYSLLVGDNLEIHEETLKAMWAKAASLVNTSGMIMHQSSRQYF